MLVWLRPQVAAGGQPTGLWTAASTLCADLRHRALVQGERLQRRGPRGPPCTPFPGRPHAGAAAGAAEGGASRGRHARRLRATMATPGGHRRKRNARTGASPLLSGFPGRPPPPSPAPSPPPAAPCPALGWAC